MSRRSWVLPLSLLFLFVGCGSSSTPLGDDASSPDNGPLPDGPGLDAAPGPRHNGPLFRRSAGDGELAAFQLDQVEVNGGGELVLPSGAGHPGSDPYAAGTYHGGNYYNGGTFRQGTARSEPWVGARGFDAVVPSFEALTPKGTWIAVFLAVRVGGAWSKDYALGVWASSTETVARHSVDGQQDATAEVAVDTLLLARKADALRFTVQLFAEGAATPRVRAVSAVVIDSAASAPADTPTPAARGKVLAVPARSQMAWPGNGWCSPTSTSMILAYWAKTLGKTALDETVPTAAAGIHDFVYDGTGNWPFNTAHAAALDGGALHGVVTRLWSLHQVERLIAAGIPVAISIAYDAGELSGAPVSSTDGHLVVVRGFTTDGDVACNDPAAATDAKVPVTYKRAELEAAWSSSYRTTYLIWPATRALPVDPLGGF